MRTFLVSSLFLMSLLPAVAFAQDAHDRISFGGDVVIAAGQRVDDVVTMGGDATIDGIVEGDVITMGGDVMVRGSVAGDVVTMGGDVALASGATVGGEVSTHGGDVATAGASRHRPATARSADWRADWGPWNALTDVTSSLLRHVLLFLFALLLLGLAPLRIGAVQAVIAREPMRVGLLGLAGGAAATVTVVLLAVSVVGVPAAVALAVGLALATYTGLAAVAGVVGAALPVAAVHGHPVRELAAGVAVLWVASLVPVVGTLGVVVAALVGLGAVVHTRWAAMAPPPGAPLGAGPFRTAATL